MRKLLTRLERGDSSQTLRAALARGACPTWHSGEQGLMNSRYLGEGNATNEIMRRSGAKRAERRGRTACEVYGALLERLTGKALRQMQHWTDIQVVSEQEGDF